MSFLNEQLVANGGSGSPSTLGRIVASKAIFDFITADSIAAIVVNGGGSKYVVGETFDIVVAGSPGAIFTARGVVVTVDDSGSPQGVVTEVKIISGGAYSTLVQSPEIVLTGLATANASAGGDDLMTVDITPEVAHWAEDRGAGGQSPVGVFDFVDGNTDFEWICSSLKASNPPTIGLETAETTGDGYVNLLVATGYDAGQIFTSQPSVIVNARLMMPASDPQIYISSTERRVNIMIRDGNFVQYGTIGFFIPFTDTEANYPFPGAQFGQTVGALPFSSSRVENQGTPGLANSGVVNAMPINSGQAAAGPYWFRDNLSPQWLNICEATGESVNLRAQMWPNNQDKQQYAHTYAAEVDGWGTDPVTDSPNNGEGILADNTLVSGWFQSNEGGARGIQGVAPLGLGNRLSFVVQPHIIANQTGDVQIIGILDGYEAVHGRGLTAFEEIVQFNGKRYVVFPDTNSGEVWRWVAMEIV